MTTQKPDLIAAWVIGPYLVVHCVLLAWLGLAAWLASSWPQLFELIPLLSMPSTPFDAAKFPLFRSAIVSACSSGVGGGIFMIREFYIKFSYGRALPEGKEFLARREIPRFTLLPFTAALLGPIALGLAKAGSITFSGLSANAEIPDFTLVALSFLLGFSYHDTLGGLSRLSKKLWGGK